MVAPQSAAHDPARDVRQASVIGIGAWHQRPRLLVSVRGAAEARAAVAGGADVIDVKEPRMGPLGRAAVAAVVDAVAAAGDRPWTLACGELRESSADDLRHHLAALTSGLAGRAAPWGVKVGLSGLRDSDWRERLAGVAAELASDVRLVAVGYADAVEVAAPPAEAVIEAASECGASAILIDTFQKRSGGVLGCRGAVWLGGIVERCRLVGLPVALAGGLAARDLPVVVALSPDIVAVRTAACRGGRLGVVAAPLVRALREALAP